VWLAKNYGAEYHLIDEFRGAPNRVAAGLADKPLPLNVDGTFYKGDTPPPPVEPDAGASKGTAADTKSDTKGDTSKGGSPLDRATTKPKK
jgi:hypothetical protein